MSALCKRAFTKSTRQLTTMTSANPQANITQWASKDGSFNRQQSSFRDFISADGPFPPEKGRYVLYVSLACPWAHRTLISRKLKGLDDIIDVSVVHPFMGKLGWSFYPPIRDEDGGYPDTDGAVGEPDNIGAVVKDPLYDSKFIRELYFKANPNYADRFTVPVLWDSKNQTIVNNESSEIIRTFNNGFNSLLSPEAAEKDYYPDELKSEIDAINEWIYPTVNNGVYRSGFATKQKPYEEAVNSLFASLDRLEDILKDGREFLVGGRLTEADIRLYTTIVRFDPVYVTHFKCNKGTIRGSYPNINKWVKNLYWNYPAFKDTTNFEHIKQHYYTSHPHINPFRIVPVGFTPDIEPL